MGKSHFCAVCTKSAHAMCYICCMTLRDGLLKPQHTGEEPVLRLSLYHYHHT